MLDGGAGSDTLKGAGGDDLLIGGPGADKMFGGDGIDTASYETASSRVEVSLGSHFGYGYDNDAAGDQLYEIENVIGSRFGDLLWGDANSNVLQGGDGSDFLHGGNADANGVTGNDTLIGGAGNDTFFGDGAEIMIGGLDDDLYWVNNVNDQVIEATGEGIDTVHAMIDYTLAANVENGGIATFSTDLYSLTGNALDNTLIGHAGTNIIDGGYGKDTMVGGGGVDVFIWSSVDEIGHFNFDPDIVTDYSNAQGDLLHFTNMDADKTVAGNQDFTFIGTAAFTAPGQINWFTNGTDTFIQLNTDADLTADGVIQLNGVTSGDAVLMFL
jgi:Ca2+-binding RTX toxin-like protein